MYINNELRDLVYKNNIRHGFWDNVRPYDEFARNVLGEIEETLDELTSGHAPTEVYFKKGNKPEGAPTELADIIIFILDYFGGSEPQIPVDEIFLETPDQYYKNPKHYEQARKMEPWKYFLQIREACMHHISLSIFHHALHGNNSYISDNGETVSVPSDLHSVIKLVLEFCDVCGINMEKELISKINYNNSRPKDYRKIGHEVLLETDKEKVYSELLSKGFGMYKEADSIIKGRQQINDEVLRKRQERAKEEQDEDER